MSDYFDKTTNRIPAGSLAKSDQINDIIDKVDTGFDLLTDPIEIQTDTSTYGVDTGAVNAYAIAMPKTQTVYTDGMQVVFKPVNSNTGASTINVDGLGTQGIKRPDGTDVLAGDLLNTQVIAIRYNGTNFILSNPASAFAASAASAAAAAVSAAAALVSENNAATSETNAASSAGGSAASAAAALVSESNAATSETNAANSAATAASESAAAVQAAKASQAETDAGTETDKWVSPATLATNTDSAATANKIVKRDSFGDFAARIISAVTFIGNLTGNSAGTHTGLVTGDLTGLVAGFYHGRVASNGSLIRLPSGWSSVRGALGVYTVLHNLNITTYTPLVTSSAIGVNASVTLIGLNSFEVKTTDDTGAAVDTAFNFMMTVDDTIN